MSRTANALRTLADLCRGRDRRHRTLGQLAAYRKRSLLRTAGLVRHRPLVVIGLVEHLGDIVAAEPVARALRERHPHARIVWAVQQRYAELLRGHPSLDGLLLVRCLTEWSYLARSRAFAAVYDLHLAGRYCAVCSFPVPRTSADPAIDVTSYYRHGSLLHAFCRTAGLEPLDADPRLVPAPLAVRREVERLRLPAEFAVLHCRSNQRERDWRDDGWAELAAHLARRGLEVVEIGLEPVLPRGGHVDLCGRLSLAATAEVVRRARLFVGVDSGPAHFAHAAATPGVVLLGNYRGFGDYVPYAGRWGRGDGVRFVRTGGALHELPFERVANAVDASLDELPGAAPGGTPRPPDRTRPAVSVVVPTYGHARYVLATLDSVFAQTFRDFEVIVVDDGSRDGTGELLEPLHRDGRIRLIRQANAGQPAARNRGLCAARGEFVALLDDDDLWPEDKLEWQVAALRAHPGAVLVHGERALLREDGPASAVEPAGPTGGEAFAGDARARFRLFNRIQSPGQTLIRGDALRAVGGFDETLWGSDDWDLYLRLAERGTFVAEPRIALHYRVHGDNASRDAIRHARNHLRVVRRHLGLRPFAVLRHQRHASRYFLSNLLRQAERESANARPGRALSALAYALTFRARLCLEPWFAAECARLLLRCVFRRGEAGAAAGSARSR